MTEKLAGLDFDALSDILCSSGELECLTCDATRNLFMKFREVQKSYMSYYRVRQTVCKKTRMTFAEYVRCTRSFRSKKIFLEDSILKHGPSGKLE